MEITIYHYLFIGLLLFLCGLIGSVLVKNVIKVLISIEFMLMGVNINFVAFASFCYYITFDGYIFAIPVAYYFFTHFALGKNVFVEFLILSLYKEW